MSAHTPGPWEFVVDGNWAIRSPAQSESLMCDEQYYPWCPANEADWHLIAAAPELLQCLQDLVELANAAMQEANRDGSEYDRVAELANARAAIAKATGEQA